MFSYFVSAKSGDNVNAAFFRVAADLAGVTLTNPEIDVQTVNPKKLICSETFIHAHDNLFSQKVVQAQIVNHAQNELEPVKAPALPQVNQEESSMCAIQ